MRITPKWLLLVLTIARAASAAGEREVAEKLIDRITQQEEQFVQELRTHTAILETYIQETPDPSGGDGTAVRDHYFLGKLDFAKGLDYTGMAAHSEQAKGSRLLSFFKSRSTVFVPTGFAQMVLLDADGFNRRNYQIDFVRREFLGEVRCLVFDVTPQDKKAAGKFKGRVWVEDHDFRIVRFNGTYTNSSASRLYFHFDSWRVNVASGKWAPAFIYAEESQPAGNGPAIPHFKAQTRLWGYNIAKSDKLEELASIAVEAERAVTDKTDSAEITPLESQRSWERQAETNILERLQKSGLLAPPSRVEDVLNTVVNNLIVTNNLNVEAKCRVLLTTPLETFSVGQTIVISRGLLDVLPDEASLAMVLAGELAHIALGHRTDTHFAFSDQTMLGEGELLRRLQLVRPEAEIASASEKAMEILSQSPYKANLSGAGLFVKALDSRSAQLPNLIRANLGNQLTCDTARARMKALADQAPPLEQDKLEQIAALPLGSRVRLDPWTDEIALVKAKPVPLISARDKLPFEVTPFMIFLSRADARSKEQDPAPINDVPAQR
ncbi:MAG: M48 family metalloprotease [Acidobacteriia bacterium]|nr:M48 family metalloprotease [Terriglobia bacterium]